jgi:hypothetical protein
VKLIKALPTEVYNELREIQFELHELDFDMDLEQAVTRITRIKQRVDELILASDVAALR